MVNHLLVIRVLHSIGVDNHGPLIGAGEPRAEQY